MAKTSLEFSLEEYFLALFRTDARLKGKSMAHADSDRQAEMNGITAECTQGDEEAGGAAGNRCDITCTWRGGSKSTAARNDLVGAAMSECVKSANTRATTAQTKFSYLVILTENLRTERPDTKNSRQRVIKVPCIAKLL